MSKELMIERIEKAQKEIEAKRETVQQGKFRQDYHFMAETGWINDPNGLIYFKGKYHFFYQYNPYSGFWDCMHWGHAVSEDMIHWEYLPLALAPSEVYDDHLKGGCFSGSAIEHDGKLFLIYTGTCNNGNGFEQAQCIAYSEDGIHFEKYEGNPVITAPEGVPTDLFRDPKIWKHDDTYYVVCGASKNGFAQARLYKSTDMFHWEFVNVLAESRGEWGFMWECPGYLELGADGGAPTKCLSFSPQGLEGGRWDRGNVYAAGYMPVTGDITGGDGTYELGEFRLWDAGFDFYAPQEFTSEDGRHILIGWMGMPDEPTYDNAPTVVCGWQHCMTVPRELTAGEDGVVLQQPARELERHYASVRVGEGSWEVAGDTCFDVVVDGVDGAFTVTVDGELKLAFVPAEGELPSRFEMRFTDEGRASAGCGRTVRWEPVDEVRNVRIVGDVSSVEVFVNDGALVFSTRIYPEAYGVTVDAPGACVTYHTLII